MVLGQMREKKVKMTRATKESGNKKMANGSIRRLAKLGEVVIKTRTQVMRKIGTGARKKTGLTGARMTVQLPSKHH
jgi:hypothetical protein